MTLPQLLRCINACTHCAHALPGAPRPVLQVHGSACLRIVSQAPGRRASEAGIPWNDKSGSRLRQWLGLTPEDFYDARRVAIMPVAFCYPGEGKSGDRAPRPECAPRWHAQLNAHLRRVQLTLLVGQFAHAQYLGNLRKASLTDTVRAWKEYLPLGFLPIVHPSPRNQGWLKKNPWFESELVPELQREIRMLNLDRPIRKVEFNGPHRQLLSEWNIMH